MIISVCMATYNGEKYIKEQIDSILCQLGENDEIIISDDESTDGTLEIIRGISDPRIRIFIHHENHGFVKNFENALKNARGEYIFLADQDDIWLSNKVKITLQHLKNADFVVSDCITVNENLETIRASRFREFRIKKGFIRLMIKTRYLGCCMAFDRKVLMAILPFPNKSEHIEHDLWVAAVSELYFKTELINVPLILYRRHGNNTSDAGETKGFPLYLKLIRRLYRLWKLLLILPRVVKIKYRKN